MTTNIKKILSLIGYNIISICMVTIFLHTIDMSEHGTTLSIIILMHLFITVVLFKLYNRSIINPIGIFVVFLYLFNFGQIILKGIFKNYKFEIFDVFLVVPNELLIESVQFNLIIIVFFVSGIFFSTLFKKNSKGTYKHKDYYKYCKPIGRLLFILSVPAMLYIDYREIQASLFGGYLSLFAVSIPGYLRILSSLFLPSIILLIYSNKDNIWARRFLLYGSIGYKLFSMLGGQRGYAIVYIIVLLYIYYSSVEKLSFKRALNMSLVGFISLSLINTIKDIRRMPNRSIEVVFSTLVESVNNNVLFRILEEFGGTLYTTALSIKYYPTDFGYLYGGSYIASLITFIPNIGEIVTNIMEDYRWAERLSTMVPGIGGSFTAELYVNFGYASFIAAFIFGLILNVFSKSFERNLSQNNYLFISTFSITFSNALLWVRGSFESLVRDTIWAFILIYGLYYLIKSLKRR